MINSICLICIGFDFAAILYYEGKYEKLFKSGFLIAMILCILGFISLHYSTIC